MPKDKLQQPAFFKRKLTLDFNNLISGVFRFAVASYTGIASTFVAAVSDIIKSIKLEDKERPSVKAYRLFLFALTEASIEVIMDFGKVDVFKKKLLSATIKEKLVKEIKEANVSFDERFLLYPSEFSLVNTFIDHFRSSLQEQGATGKILYGLEEKFKSYYLEAFHRRFSSGYSDFSDLENYLINATTPAYRREQEWNDYRALLIKQVYEPIFNEHFGLRQIYVPLNGYYEYEKKVIKEDKAWFQKILMVCKMEEELDHWLEHSDKNDCLRIISGDPGAGKSTIAKVWASKLAERKKRIIYVSLNQIRKSTSPDEVINEFIGSKFHRFQHNPYDLLGKEEDEPLLLIFDGLDEWVAEDSKSVDSVKVFIHNVLKMLREANGRTSLLKVLLLSRPIAIQENLKWFKQDCRIYHLLSLFVTHNFGKDLSERHIELLEEDKRPLWKSIYTKFNQLNFDEELLFQTKGELAEISAQPLLIYLLTIALNANEGKIDPTSLNINTIYALILTHVHSRKYNQEGTHLSIREISQESYFRIMENIACSAWRRGDERTTTRKNIDAQFQLQPKSLQRIWHQYKNEKSQYRDVESLLSSFYFKKKEEESEDSLYEFTHKSFGEYLMAKHIVRKLEKWSNIFRGDLDASDDENHIISKFFEHFHFNTFEEYLKPYIERELIIRKKENPTIVLQWQEDLSLWMDYLQINSLNLSHLHFTKSVRAILYDTACLENNLICLLSLCAKVNDQYFVINSWQGSDEKYNSKFLTWLHLYTNSSNEIGQSISVEQNLFRIKIKDAYLKGAHLQGAHLQGAHLQRAHLKNALLQGARLENTNLQNALLQGAHLKEVHLEGAHLESANLEGAHLEKAHLQGAYLANAYLRGANLESAHLENAHLENAVLQEAHLEKTCLQGAFLQESHLQGTYLQGVNLQNAQLRKALLQRTKLGRADLRGADLREAELEKADLRGADLREANLQGADLQEADLRGTYLQRAKLQNTNFQCTNLEGADLRNVTFKEADLREGVLRKVDLRRANLEKVDLRNADLRNANLERVSLRNTNLEGANLEGVVLWGANLENANLENVNLRNVNFQDAIGLTITQLSQAKTLYNCKNLPLDIYKALQADKYKHLWVNPDE